MKKVIKKLNCQFERLDAYVIETVGKVVRPAERRKQVMVLLDRLDRKVYEIAVDVISPERRKQAVELVATTVARGRDAYRKVRDEVRRPEAPEVLALREDANSLVERFNLLISKTADDAVHPSWVVELSRWHSIMTLEASGDREQTTLQVIEQLSGQEAMRAGDRALMRHVRRLTESRGLTDLERSVVLAIMQARMTLARIRQQRGDISADDLAWELADAVQNLRSYLVSDGTVESIADVRAIIEAMPDSTNRTAA